MCSEYGLLVAFDGLYGVTIRQLLLTVRNSAAVWLEVHGSTFN